MYEKIIISSITVISQHEKIAFFPSPAMQSSPKKLYQSECSVWRIRYAALPGEEGPGRIKELKYC
jgi:hypothetical protein